MPTTTTTVTTVSDDPPAELAPYLMRLAKAGVTNVTVTTGSVVVYVTLPNGRALVQDGATQAEALAALTDLAEKPATA